MRVTTHPTITINNQTYLGDLDGKDIAIALCASFRERPEVCYDQKFEVLKADDSEFVPVQIENHMVRNLFIAGLFIIFINIGMVCIHKKFRQESNKNEIQLEVNQAVSQYFALRGEEMQTQRDF